MILTSEPVLYQNETKIIKFVARAFVVSFVLGFAGPAFAEFNNYRGDSSCPSTPESSEAVQKYKVCAQKMALNVEKGIVIDADQNVAYIVDAKSGGGEPKCFKIALGGPTNGGSGNARLGNVTNENMTPPGMLLTFNKTDSSVFHSPDQYCGLKGTNGDNNKTADRGVLLHACNGEQQTHGCICFAENWQEIKKLVQGQSSGVGTPVFVYAKSMKGDGCPDGSIGPQNPGGKSGTSAGR